MVIREKRAQLEKMYIIRHCQWCAEEGGAGWKGRLAPIMQGWCGIVRMGHTAGFEKG